MKLYKAIIGMVLGRSRHGKKRKSAAEKEDQIQAEQPKGKRDLTFDDIFTKGIFPDNHAEQDQASLGQQRKPFSISDKPNYR